MTEAQDKRKKRSRLLQWPCKLKRVPEVAPYLDGADLLISADCAAYARQGFHEEFMKGKITLTACPALDGADYYERFLSIIKENKPRSITLVRMETGCCSLLEAELEKALNDSGSIINYTAVTLTTGGDIKTIKGETIR